MKTAAFILLLIAGSGSIAEAQTCAPAPVGLVSWYSADGNALDPRSRNNGTLQSGATFAAGHVGQAFSLDGTNSFVSIPHNDSFNVSSLTLDAWVNTDTLTLPPDGNPRVIVSKYNTVLGSAGASWYLAMGPSGKLEFFVAQSNFAYRFIQTDAPALTAGAWFHVAGTFNMATQELKIYVNGVETPSTLDPASATITSIAQNTASVNIGMFVNSANQIVGIWDGLIDEAGIYNRALSAAEIAAIAGAGTAGKCKATATVAPTGQVGWWAGDGNAKDTAGTINGAFTGSSNFSIGKVGQSFNFNGTGASHVEVPDNAALDFTSALTVEMWFNPAASGPTNATTIPILKGDSNSFTGSPYFIAFVNDTIIFRISNGSTFDQLHASIPVPLNSFSHVAATYDGSTMKIYINGVLAASTSTTIGTLFNSPLPLFIGKATSPHALDEVSLYNRTLSDAEITSIFNAGLAGKLKQNTNSLVSLWQGEGNANDTRGPNNGTLLNGTAFAAGQIGQAFSFDGVDDFVQVPHNASIDFGANQNFTIKAWIKVNSGEITDLGGFIVSKHDGGNSAGYFFYLEQNGTIGFDISDGVPYYNLTGGNVANGQWRHVVGQRDGAVTRIFVDGQLAASMTATAGSLQNNDPLVMGDYFDLLGSSNFKGQIDEVEIHNRALTAAEIQTNYETGIGLPTVVGDATITFPTITAAKTTQQIPLDMALFPVVPLGTHTGLAYDIATNSVFTGNATVCFNLPAFTSAQFTDLRVLHFTGGGWVNVTNIAGSSFPSLCTTGVSSFSPFAIVSLAPSAASVVVGGRVVTATGRGISKSRVSITGPDGITRTVLTGSFGYYRFSGVQAGETYTVTVRSKGYQFENPTRVVTVTDELTDLDFTALVTSAKTVQTKSLPNRVD